MIKKFWHVGLTVEDLEQGITEYKKLGFEVVQRFDKPEPKARAAHLKYQNGSGIELWQWVDKVHPQVKFIKSHLAFKSDDMEGDVKDLEAMGWRVVIPKTVGITVTYTFVQDPSGNCIEIAEDKDERS